LGESASRVSSFQFGTFAYQNSQVIVAHTGYTGEAGVEIFVPSALTVNLWRELLEKGARHGVKPIGLGARDTLRTEMKFSLYGHEIDDETNPYAALLGWVVKPKAKDYLGKEMMLAARQQGLKQKLVGFTLLEKGIPRQGYSLFSFDNKEIGRVTSGTLSPSLNISIGIAYVDSEFSAEGSEFAVDIRGRKTRAKVVKTPFVHTK
jgi:aminomethyltransferase